MGHLSIRQQGKQQHASRSSAAGFSDRTRSYSAGRLNHYSTARTADAYQQDPHQAATAAYQQKQQADGYLPSNLTAGVLTAAVLTQWNAGPSCWDWGMGWGWTGWNAAFCGTCAMEQAALAGHVPALAAQQHHQSAAAYSAAAAEDPSASQAQFYFDDDHELGELGETADVGCDFGDFGGF